VTNLPLADADVGGIESPFTAHGNIKEAAIAIIVPTILLHIDCLLVNGRLVVLDIDRYQTNMPFQVFDRHFLDIVFSTEARAHRDESTI